MTEITTPAVPPPVMVWPTSIPSPKQIVAHLDRSVVGQDRAKRTLAIAVSNHFVRLRDARDRSCPAPSFADPSLRQDVADHRIKPIVVTPHRLRPAP